MIYTFTTNPSLDYIVRLAHFVEGRTNRTVHEEIKVGGKGINTSIVLGNLGIDSIATGVIGGFTGEHIQQVLTEQYPRISCDFVRGKRDTRINVKLKGEQETEINGRGEEISVDIAHALLAKAEQVAPSSLVCLSGSVEQKEESNLFRDMAAILSQKKIEFVVDNSSQKLLEILPYGPLLVKPNKDELSQILGEQFKSEAEIIKGGRQLLDLGAKNVIVSLGADGALFINQSCLYKATPPNGELINSVGAGDSMIAGFIYAFLNEMAVEDCFRHAVAAGTATAYSEHLASYETMKDIYERTFIQRGDSNGY